MYEKLKGSTTAEQEQLMVPSAQISSPNLEFLVDTREVMNIYFTQCVPLHKYALQGNWKAAKHTLDENPRLKTAALTKGWSTVLHVAVGASHVHFVKELLKLLDNNAIALQDKMGNTAFCFAAAAGNWHIAELMLKRNPCLPTIRGGNGMTPVHFAALQGRCPMACRLYRVTKHVFGDKDWELLFFTCIQTCNYHLALKMVSDREKLAYARDENGDTALHLLAQIQKPLDSCCHCSEHQKPIMMNPGMKHVVFQLVNFLWSTLCCIIDSKSKIIDIISEPSQLLFDAAKVGNFGFLSELMSIYPSLIWEVDNKNQSIIHTAVLHRHASIFNLIHEIGPLKDIIVSYSLEENNTLLHLAAKLAPPNRLELISGAALQMSLELSWFEEVKKIMPPSYIKSRNSDGLTAQELFTKEHAELRKNAESWMKRTANSCMLISTVVIATAVFSSAFIIPDGANDGSGKPNYFHSISVLVCLISNATALISASASVLIFLSILVSRWVEYDFHRSLPLKLMFGRIMLFISGISTAIAFSSAFFTAHYYDLKWSHLFISFLTCTPLIVLLFSQWTDIIYSINRRALFTPGKRMIYMLEK